MSYCLEHPSRKMLLMPVEPFEANKSCYVCSEQILLLEINTGTTKLRDFVEKIVRNKLGMNLPIIMHGANLIYEAGDDIEEDIAANYARNLDKVLAELPSQVTNGTVLTVEDLQQELTCNINIKHREEFDEEKDPDGMILSGWSGPLSNNEIASNGETNSTPSAAAETENADAPDVVPEKPHSGSKRKISEVEESSGNLENPSSQLSDRENPHQVDDNNDGDDDDVAVLVALPEAVKKLRVQPAD